MRRGISTMRRRALRIGLAILVMCPYSEGALAEPQRATLGNVELLAEQASWPADGGTVTLGFYLQPDDGWHAYWRNPGDAGVAPRVKWHAPEGFSVSEFAFPTPHLIPYGPLNTYGYDEPILLFADVTVPPGLIEGDEATISGIADWVVCDNAICVPDKTDVALTLVVGNGAHDLLVAERFAIARERLPTAVNWSAEYAVNNDNVTVAVEIPPDAAPASEVYMFPAGRGIVNYDDQKVSFLPDGLAVTMSAHRKVDEHRAFPILLTYSDANGKPHAVTLTAPRASGTLSLVGAEAAAAEADSLLRSAEAVELDTLTLGTALLFGFLGGVILNLMPCVFPILSIKALGLVKLSQENLTAKAARESGLLYTAGVLAAFAATGITLVLLREGGQAVGWGFQMQSPVFNLVLGLLMLAIALNLFGVFEIGTRIVGLGQSLTQSGDRKADFFAGLLAVAVATPCTAPFMAGALGFALSQPAVSAVAIFLSLGMGLAFPYLFLSFAPKLGRRMPKPGPWMATLKHLLAFPMLATSLWLFWVLGRQTGVDSMSIALVAALCFAFALWAWGRSASARGNFAWRTAALAGAAACVFAITRVDDYQTVDSVAGGASAGNIGSLAVEHFSPEAVTNYIAAGQPLFLYFSADWCVSCKVNERVALASDTVAAGFAERNIKVIEADWTSRDPVVTEWLERYDRIGVPLYLYFPTGANLSTVTILPQILTPGLVIDAIDRANADASGSTRFADEAKPAESMAGDAQSDWARVQAYLDLDAPGPQPGNDVRDIDQERRNRFPAALSAALAIATADEYHPKSFDVAEFLLRHAQGADDTPLKVATTLISNRLLAHERLPELLYWLDSSAEAGAIDEVEALFADLANDSDSASMRGLASYYSASRLLRRINRPGTPAGDRVRYRDVAAGYLAQIDAEVADEKVWRFRRDAEELYLFPLPTLGQMRDDMRFVLDHSAAGGTPLTVVAADLDGSQQDLSQFRGQVVLMEFWATWCGSCRMALPKVRALDDRLPDDSFEIVSLSIDDTPQDVVDFQIDNPMPWSNWHIGPDSEIWKAFAVRGTPTYLLLDADGIVRARDRELDSAFYEQIDDLLMARSD